MTWKSTKDGVFYVSGVRVCVSALTSMRDSASATELSTPQT